MAERMIRPAASTSFYCATIFPPMLPAKKSGAGAVSVKDFSSEAMLVLSARQGEAILLPEAAITFCFLLKRRLRVRLVGSGVANVRGLYFSKNSGSKCPAGGPHSTPGVGHYSLLCVECNDC